MNKPAIAVFFGGCSPEYHISLQSAAAVLEAFPRERYTPVPVGITCEGRWYSYTGDTQAIREDRWLEQGRCVPAILSPDRSDRGLFLLESGGVLRLPVDAALPIMHGSFGEDGTIQGLIALAGIPLVGCGVLASALGMDKERAHRLAAQAGIETARSVTLNTGESPQRALDFAREIGWPVFIKPMRAGSSKGVSRAAEEKDLLPALQAAFRYDTRVIVEEAIPGFEVGCAVIGTKALTTGAVDEIELSGGFLDYAEKYTPKASVTHVPARVSPETAKRIQETAKTVYRALDCSGFARVDLFLTPKGRILFNEVNTIPGCTPHSRFPAMLAAAGLSLSQVFDQVIGEALK